MKKLFRKSFNPKHVIDFYLKKADKIKHDNIYNYAYTYCLKTPNGMLLNVPLNHQYGKSREGFEQWKEDNPDLHACHNGTVSLRPIKTRDGHEKIIGYILEERLSDLTWHNEVLQLVDDCFDKLCEELKVVDKPTFRYFIFSENMGYEDYSDELLEKLRMMVHAFEEYQDNEEYRNLVDKIKG